MACGITLTVLTSGTVIRVIGSSASQLSAVHVPTGLSLCAIGTSARVRGGSTLPLQRSAGDSLPSLVLLTFFVTGVLKATCSD
jgi:hypothetical protein